MKVRQWVRRALYLSFCMLWVLLFSLNPAVAKKKRHHSENKSIRSDNRSSNESRSDNEDENANESRSDNEDENANESRSDKEDENANESRSEREDDEEKSSENYERRGSLKKKDDKREKAEKVFGSHSDRVLSDIVNEYNKHLEINSKLDRIIELSKKSGDSEYAAEMEALIQKEKKRHRLVMNRLTGRK